MNHFHNSKIIATIGPSIDKETVLAKIINNIDIFNINLSHGDEDTKKKYINMVVKLDSSKTIMLDTKGPEIKTRNKEEITLKKNKQVKIRYAEFFKQEDDTLFIDYINIDHITVGTFMSIDNDSVCVEILENNKDHLIGKVKTPGTVLINRGVEFENYIPQLAFLSEKDKKHIIWGVENKAHLIAVSYIRDKENIKMIQDFLKDIHGTHLQIIAKIETREAIDNIEEIIQLTGGIILNRVKLKLLLGEEEAEKAKLNIIKLCHKHGKPVSIQAGLDVRSKNHEKQISIIQEELKLGVDTFMLTKETAVAEEPIEMLSLVYETINNTQYTTSTNYTLEDMYIQDERDISDYIVFNAYRVSKEMNIKAIICPTESGHTPARISSLKPNVPIIAFTKNDDAYRYMNLLRGVKGYKISHTFDYTNIKQLGKEIIRILFKGNISLDDKVLIVHSSIEQNISNMINGIELYKFKDI